MASAVSMISVRRVSYDEKESSMSDRKVGDGSVLLGERQEKKKWLLAAMEA